MLALRLPKEIEDRLAALAKKTGRTKSYYARRAILNYIEDLEDIAIAEERLKDPNAEWLSLEEVYARLDLDTPEKPQQALNDLDA
jgi:RHH-type transcriptional regulator, rel operon repressor / antitoxin RelB